MDMWCTPVQESEDIHSMNIIDMPYFQINILYHNNQAETSIIIKCNKLDFKFSSCCTQKVPQLEILYT